MSLEGKALGVCKKLREITKRFWKGRLTDCEEILATVGEWGRYVTKMSLGSSPI